MPAHVPQPSTDLAAPAAPRLRDSCNACAASKVKCDKTKPVCGRCSTRGTPCQYLAAKRAGRTGRDQLKRSLPRSPPTTTPLSAPELPPTTSVIPPSSLLSDHNPTEGPTSDREFGLIRPSTRHLTTSSSAADLPDLFSPQHPTVPPLSASTAAELDDFLALLSSAPATDSYSLDFSPDHLQRASTATDTGFLDFTNLSSLSTSPAEGFSAAADEANVAFSDPFALPNLPAECKTSTTASHSSSGSVNDARTPSTDASCTCLFRAMSLLERLLKLAPTLFLQPGSPEADSRGPPRAMRVRSLLTEYDTVTDAICSILRCGCSHRGYMISLIALSMSKLLEGYRAAAFGKETPSSAGAPGPSDSHSLCCTRDFRDLASNASPPPLDAGQAEMEEDDRIAAQLVLGELHRVQGLISLLTERIKTQVPRCTSDGSPGTMAEPAAGSEEAWAFSADMLDRMAAELRCRLRALSLQIIDMLRL